MSVVQVSTLIFPTLQLTLSYSPVCSFNLYKLNDVLDKVGMDVFASTNDVPPMKENEYYVDDLVGLQVLNTNNEILGTVTDVIDIPSGYLLEITDKTNNNSFLVPFVDAFVKSIDDEKIIIEEIEGLRS